MQCWTSPGCPGTWLRLLVASTSLSPWGCHFSLLKKWGKWSNDLDSLEPLLEFVKWSSVMKERFSAAQQIGQLLRKSSELSEWARNRALSFPECEFSWSHPWSPGCGQNRGLRPWVVKHTRPSSRWECCLALSLIVVLDLEDFTTKSSVFIGISHGMFLWNIHAFWKACWVLRYHSTFLCSPNTLWIQMYQQMPSLAFQPPPS